MTNKTYIRDNVLINVGFLEVTDICLSNLPNLIILQTTVSVGPFNHSTDHSLSVGPSNHSTDHSLCV